MGVPNSIVTGGMTGTATGGSDDIHFGTSGILTSRILILLRLISGMGIREVSFQEQHHLYLHP